jgi:hypothetical protein
VFSNLGFANPGVVPSDQRVLESSLEVVNVESDEREAVHVTREHIEAPNWSRDGRSFLFNSEGRLYELPRSGGKPRLFDTGFECETHRRGDVQDELDDAVIQRAHRQAFLPPGAEVEIR